MRAVNWLDELAARSAARTVLMRGLFSAAFLALACGGHPSTGTGGTPKGDAGVLGDAGTPSGDAGVRSDAGTPPIVGTDSRTYPTAGAPFEAIAASNGEVFVSV